MAAVIQVVMQHEGPLPELGDFVDVSVPSGNNNPINPILPGCHCPVDVCFYQKECVQWFVTSLQIVWWLRWSGIQDTSIPRWTRLPRQPSFQQQHRPRPYFIKRLLAYHQLTKTNKVPTVGVKITRRTATVIRPTQKKKLIKPIVAPRPQGNHMLVLKDVATSVTNTIIAWAVPLFWPHPIVIP